MPRYRLEIEETFRVHKTAWVEIDAASPEDAQALIDETCEAFDVPVEELDTLPALQEAGIRIREQEEQWDHEHTFTHAVQAIAELSDPNQKALFGP